MQPLDPAFASEPPAEPAAIEPRVSAWVAVLLSCACTGLGHLYAGAERRGLVFFLLSLLFVPTAAVAAVLPASRGALMLLLAALALSVGTALTGLVDAARTARRMRGRSVERLLWRPGVVSLFLAVGLAFPLGAALVLRTWCLEAFLVASGSMEPSFQGGDRIVVDKRAYRAGGPRRGDVVVFCRPEDGGRAYIKRVVGLPGERVAVVGGEVLINGRALPRVPAPEAGAGAYWEGEGVGRYLVRLDADASRAPDVPEAVVGAERVFLLGDRRGSSLDSRTFGAVPLEQVVGPATYVVWPAGSWARFGPIR